MPARPTRLSLVWQPSTSWTCLRSPPTTLCEVFNVAIADLPVAATTQEIQDRFYDGVDVRRDMGRDETFYAIDKARELLGFAPRHSWRDVLAPPGAPGTGS